MLRLPDAILNPEFRLFNPVVHKGDGMNEEISVGYTLLVKD